MPAHNEASHLQACLQSFAAQTLTPNQLLIVNDNSTDQTLTLAQNFAKHHPWAQVIDHKSNTTHQPGAKVIAAFKAGLAHLNPNYQLLGKFDADIVLPPNYLQTVVAQFTANPQLGMCGGILHTLQKGSWQYENIAKPTHLRGPIKMYRRTVYQKMEGLRQTVGWDTADTLLCQYYQYQIQTLPQLVVKHLRPTGHGYSTKKYQAKGQALYQMRYQLPISLIALAKMAWQAKKFKVFTQGTVGFIKAWLLKCTFMVSKKQGRFIRKLRWQGIFGKK